MNQKDKNLEIIKKSFTQMTKIKLPYSKIKLIKEILISFGKKNMIIKKKYLKGIMIGLKEQIIKLIKVVIPF